MPPFCQPARPTSLSDVTTEPSEDSSYKKRYVSNSISNASKESNKNCISSKIANRKKPRRRPTSHVAADNEITKQVARSASVIAPDDDDDIDTSERSQSVPAESQQIILTDWKLRELALRYQRQCEAAQQQQRKSRIPVLKNQIWKHPVKFE